LSALLIAVEGCRAAESRPKGRVYDISHMLNR
jgi:hypothetical protein